MAGQHSSLPNSHLFIQDISPQVSSANVQCVVIDMQGWDGCTFEYNIGAMASGATFTSTIFNSANANMSGNTVVNQNVAGTVTNANLASIANTANSNLAIVDVYKPNLRYIQNLAQPATANVTFGVTAIRYRRTGVLPPTQVTQQLVAIVCN